MMDKFFPLEASVLASSALSDYIKLKYFPSTFLVCRLFYRSLHDTYKITTANEAYYFKVYRQGIRSLEEIQAEIDLLNYLKTTGIEVSYPVMKQDGTYIGQFHTTNGIRYGVLYASVGTSDFNELEETPDLNEKLGSYIASLHNAFDKYDFDVNCRDLNSNLFIDDSMSAIRQFSTIHHFDINFLEEVAKSVKEKLESLTTKKPQYGICHGDIYGGNLRVNTDNNPILFDFDFCGNGWRAYDISMYAFPFGMGSDLTKLEKREHRKSQFFKWIQ